MWQARREEEPIRGRTEAGGNGRVQNWGRQWDKGSHYDQGGPKRVTVFSFSLALAKESLKEEILESECFGMLPYAS